jgi:hypothetical protein
VIHQVQRALVHPSAETAWADGSRFAAEGDNVVLATGFAVEVREAACENPAVEVLVQFFSYERGQRLAAGVVGPLLLEGQQVLLQHLVKGSFLRLPA